MGAALRTLATSGREDVVRLHAAWALEGLGLADAELVRRLLRDRSHHVRAAALRLSEPLIDSPPMLHAVLALAKEPKVQVRRQLVYSLGASRLPKAQDALFELLMRDADEPFVVHAALSGLAGREAAVLEQVIASGDSKGERSAMSALITALALAITNEGREDGVERLIGHALHEEQPAWRAAALLQGMAASTRTELPVAPERLAGLRDVGRPELRTAAQQVWKKFARGNEAVAAASAKGPAAAPGVLERGRAGYAVCAGCHQADGRGLPALAPSLHGTPRVTGPPEALIDAVLGGTDEDAAFPSMPPLAGMRDDQLAAILTYVRQAWGNDAPPITAEDVRRRRMARANR